MASSIDQLPHFAEGTVVAGFGRGSKELGIPTANFPEDVIRRLPAQFECGVYYGWAKVGCSNEVYKMVMCIGWNPYYHNTVKTMETHIIHKFNTDFYGDHLKIIAIGFIRPMCDFKSLDELISAIHKDIADANGELEKPECLKYRDHPFFKGAAPPLPSHTDGDLAPGVTAAVELDHVGGGSAVDGKTYTNKVDSVSSMHSGMECKLSRDPENPGQVTVTCNVNDSHSHGESGENGSNSTSNGICTQETSCCAEKAGKNCENSNIKAGPCTANDSSNFQESPTILTNGHVENEDIHCGNCNNNTNGSICRL